MTMRHELGPVAVAQRPTTAIVGLVLALLFWPAGLLVSKQALRTSRRRGGSGKRLAVAGIALSVLSGTATVLLLTASAVGAVRSGPVLTDGQSAACQMRLEDANHALAAYTTAAEAPLRGDASARLAALQGAGYLADVPDIPGLGLDVGGRFTSAC